MKTAELKRRKRLSPEENQSTGGELQKSAQKRGSLEPVFNPQQSNMLQQVSEDFPSKIGHFHRAFGGVPRSAITAKCIECVWGDTAAIRECPATACPLYAQRPYREVRHD